MGRIFLNIFMGLLFFMTGWMGYALINNEEAGLSADQMKDQIRVACLEHDESVWLCETLVQSSQIRPDSLRDIHRRLIGDK